MVSGASKQELGKTLFIFTRLLQTKAIMVLYPSLNVFTKEVEITHKVIFLI